MKKILLLALALVPVLGWAQSIPNNSFEQWVPDSSNPLDPNAEIPVDWIGTTFGGAVTKVTGGQAGAFAMNIKVADFMGFPFPGILTTQFPSNGTTSRFLNGFVRKTGGLGDTLYVTCAYSRDTTGTGGGGQMKTTLSPQWTPFSIEMMHNPGQNPDSVAIVMLTAGIGSGFEIDNLSLSNTAIGGPLGPVPTSNKAKLRKGTDLSATVYPNPANGEEVKLTVNQLSGLSRLEVRIVDVLGNTVWTASRKVSASQEELTLKAGGLKKGIYHIVIDNSGRRTVVPFVKN